MMPGGEEFWWRQRSPIEAMADLIDPPPVEPRTDLPVERCVLCGRPEWLSAGLCLDCYVREVEKK